MQKWIFPLLVSLLFMNGCSIPKKNIDETMKIYESSIDAVINNKGIESKNIPFDYDLNVYKLKNNSYEFEVNVYNPRVAMYNVQAIAVNPELDSNVNIHPCLGLLGEDAFNKFHLVPSQSNPKRGFYKGFSLEGISTSNQFSLNVMVMWLDSDRITRHNVFFTLNFVEELNDDALGEKITKDK